MKGFERLWISIAKTRDGEAVSANLRPLLHRVYNDFSANPVDLQALKNSLVELLRYLNDEGRTNANCWTVDLFFCSDDWEEHHWTEQDLPEGFHDLLAMMGEALHDTVSSPEIALDFGCLPEQLLKFAEHLET
ncbi:MAG TPA: hypothetical protein VGR47_15930 [Terracidiphilus sp.]|nr:hypothetical protein [Terracidiphilus sp.]